MLFHFFQWLSNFESNFSVFQYISLRAILTTMTALIITLLFGQRMIDFLTNLKLKQTTGCRTPQRHQLKTGTPTMGGLLILSAIIIATLLWTDLSNSNVWIAVVVTFGFGLVGFIDDYLKIRNTSADGLPAKIKYLLLSVIAISVAISLFFLAKVPAQTDLLIPYFKDVNLSLGWLFVPLVYFVLVGTSNAVNLTDGLDGLAVLPAVMISAALAVFCYVGGHFFFSDYLLLPYIVGNGDIALFCCAIVGAGLGFLWFNTYPAQIFMGDVGSLGLGGAMAIAAILARQEVVFFIMAGLFVVETLSVILQVGSYKLRGKRIFLMAPIHHHFEMKGWAEPKIIVRFWIVTLILVLIGLASLKIR